MSKEFMTVKLRECNGIKSKIMSYFLEHAYDHLKRVPDIKPAGFQAKSYNKELQVELLLIK